MLKRIDIVAPAVEKATCKKLLVDHHLEPGDFCDVTISHPQISSTSELVFRLICALGGYPLLTREAAECIYTGMMTDTGGFTFNSNNREIYIIIGQLLDKGIDKDEIYRRVYNTYSESRLRLMGFVLSRMYVYRPLHAALISLTKQEQSRFNCIRGDSEGFVNLPLQIKGMRLSISLREDTERDNLVFVSLRSVDDFPCNEMAARFFNGGGHFNASGGRLACSIGEAEEITRQAIAAYESKLK